MKNKILMLLLTSAALAACQGKEVKKDLSQNDCSTIFEDSRNNFAQKQFNENRLNSLAQGKEGEYLEHSSTECKILPIKISKDSKCEIAGSAKIDNILEFYSQDNSQRTILIVPLEQFMDDKITSYTNIVLYHKVTSAIRERLNSEVFDDIKDYAYKGLNCDISGEKFTSWIGNNQVVIAIDEKQIVSKDKVIKKTEVTKKKVIKKKNVRKNVKQ